MNSFDSVLPQCSVLDSFIAYRDTGRADTPVAVFLHGNPTSSYLWRNVIPHVAPVARCLAPDLIGFGQSGKPDIAYRFDDHVRYLDAFLDAMHVTSAYLVAQDWGAPLAFHLAARRPDFVRGLAFMEFVRPAASWEDFHHAVAARELFQKFRTPGVGEALLLDANVFVEKVLPGSALRRLTDEEMAVYRAPFSTRESRLPVWRLPNEIPIDGEPADVYDTLRRSQAALAASTYPKLLFACDPGALETPAFAETFAASLHNCELVRLGAGLHNPQEDHPEVIGRAIADWIRISVAPVAVRRNRC